MSKSKQPKKGKRTIKPTAILTGKQRLFIEAYLTLLNGRQAAIKAGYPENSASEVGYENLRKPQIRKIINERLSEMTLNPQETLKAISNIAEADLNEYFVIKEVWTTPKVKKHLTEIIQDIKNKIEDEDKFISRADISSAEMIQAHNDAQKSRRLDILKHEIELERSPEASRIVNGEPYLTKVAELDMVKLVSDKISGRIKSYKMTEFGVNVELYPADAALRDLARVHGLYEKDNKQQQTVITVNTQD